METRPSADCQTTFVSTFQLKLQNFENSRWTVTQQSSEVTRPSADCQRTFFGRSAKLAKFWEKSLNGQWSEVTRLLTDCQTTFFVLSSKLGIFRKTSLNGQTTVVGGHATVGRLSNNFFTTNQAIRKFFEKVAERSRDSRRSSRDRRLTVIQLYSDVSAKMAKFRKKSLNGHATVVAGHATVGWLSNSVYRRSKQLGNVLEKVAEWSRDSSRRSRDRRSTVYSHVFDIFGIFGKRYIRYICPNCSSSKL